MFHHHLLQLSGDQALLLLFLFSFFILPGMALDTTLQVCSPTSVWTLLRWICSTHCSMMFDVRCVPLASYSSNFLGMVSHGHGRPYLLQLHLSQSPATAQSLNLVDITSNSSLPANVNQYAQQATSAEPF